MPGGPWAQWSPHPGFELRETLHRWRGAHRLLYLLLTFREQPLKGSWRLAPLQTGATAVCQCPSHGSWVALGEGGGDTQVHTLYSQGTPGNWWVE